MWKYWGREPQPSKSNYVFKMQHSFDKRRNESNKVLEKYPTHIPVIIERSDHSMLPDLKKTKYLFNSDITIGQIIFTLRKNIELESTEAIYLYVDNSFIPSISDKISDIYKKYNDKDGFLYITYAAENTFG
jgi:GABA(A) receptor-associated protein